MSYDVYWVKNRAEKIADFAHPTQKAEEYNVSLPRLDNDHSERATSGLSFYAA